VIYVNLRVLSGYEIAAKSPDIQQLLCNSGPRRTVKDMDARVAATRRRLREAILELATAKDLGEITVTEVARAAGIDRSTFYQHADSPTALLVDVLHEELDPLRAAVEETLDRDPASLARVGTELNARLADHVEQHADLYADRGDGRINSALYAALSSHTRTALEQVFEHLAEAGAPVPAAADERRYLAAFVAYGVVGAIATWLAEPGPRDRGRLERALAPVYDAWLVPAATTVPPPTGGIAPTPIEGDPS
jgi:AcrR family transcriptional regulator